MSCFLWFLLALEVSETCLLLDDLDNFEYYSDIFQKVLYWGFSDIFIPIIPGLYLVQRKTTEGKCHFHHITLKVYNISMMGGGAGE